MTATAQTVIVGAGSSGGVIAARLTEDPDRSVLLLEAGPDFGPDPDDQPPDVADASDVGPTPFDWGLSAEFGPLERTSPVFAGRLVGGSSATNNVMALRGQDADYEAWRLPGWSQREVRDAFVRVERDLDFGDRPDHGTDGPIPIRRCPVDQLSEHQQAFLRSCVEAGHAELEDHNAPRSIGAGVLPLNEIDGVRQSTALTCLATARRRPNLTIRAGAQVDRVLLRRYGTDGLRATGVRLVDGREVQADSVILAAGTYGSPAILLRSGIGPTEELRELGITPLHQLPGVGANLHDHPLLRLEFGTDDAPLPLPCQTLLTARSSPELDRPDLQLFPSAVMAGQDGAALTLLVALLRPASRGRIRLRSADPAVPPAIDLGLLRDPDDLARLVAGVREARRLATVPPFADHLRAAARPAEDDLEGSIRGGINVYQHPVGTCRMGPADDRLAVVGPTGRVRGCAGLTVIDASIMPTIPAANTNLPTLMIAERLARTAA